MSVRVEVSMDFKFTCGCNDNLVWLLHNTTLKHRANYSIHSVSQRPIMSLQGIKMLLHLKAGFPTNHSHLRNSGLYASQDSFPLLDRGIYLSFVWQTKKSIGISSFLFMKVLWSSCVLDISGNTVSIKSQCQDNLSWHCFKLLPLSQHFPKYGQNDWWAQ